MAEHVSFVASDDIADWLRDEADRRALTVEATVQELLAAAYRADADADGRDSASPGADTSPTAGGVDVDGDDDLAALADEVASQSTRQDALDRHLDAWTVERRGGEKYYVVTAGGERSVHSSRSGAADALERQLDRE